VATGVVVITVTKVMFTADGCGGCERVRVTKITGIVVPTAPDLAPSPTPPSIVLPPLLPLMLRCERMEYGLLHFQVEHEMHNASTCTTRQHLVDGKEWTATNDSVDG
jgi:hypothetical protein